jgi:hypothetical protein
MPEIRDAATPPASHSSQRPFQPTQCAAQRQEQSAMLRLDPFSSPDGTQTSSDGSPAGPIIFHNGLEEPSAHGSRNNSVMQEFLPNGHGPPLASAAAPPPVPMSMMPATPNVDARAAAGSSGPTVPAACLACVCNRPFLPNCAIPVMLAKYLQSLCSGPNISSATA